MASASPLLEPLEAPRARFTEQEYFHMYEVDAFNGVRFDLVWGELERMAPSGLDHGALLIDVGAKLRTAFDRERFYVGSDVFTRLFPEFIRAPDVVVARLPLPDRKALAASAVLLAVEVADATLRHDLVAKALNYAQAGIPHYWVVDVAKRLTHVHARPTEDGYSERSTVAFDAPLALPEIDAAVVLAD